MTSHTPLPWKVQKREDYPTGVRIYGYDGKACSIGDFHFEADAHLTCESVNSAPTLKAENESLRSRVAELETITRNQMENLREMRVSLDEMVQIHEGLREAFKGNRTYTDASRELVMRLGPEGFLSRARSLLAGGEGGVGK